MVILVKVGKDWNLVLYGPVLLVLLICCVCTYIAESGFVWMYVIDVLWVLFFLVFIVCSENHQKHTTFYWICFTLLLSRIWKFCFALLLITFTWFLETKFFLLRCSTRLPKKWPLANVFMICSYAVSMLYMVHA